MNELEKLENNAKHISETEPVTCDSSSHLFMIKLLGQHSKENSVLEMKEQDEKKISTPTSEFPPTMDLDKALNIANMEFNMWHSVGPIKPADRKLSESDNTDNETVHRTYSEQYLVNGGKLFQEMLSTRNTNNKEEISRLFLAMSRSPECCTAIRQSGCLPILLQLIHDSETNKTVRQQASQALHLIVQHSSVDKISRREFHVLRLIEQILEYCDNDEVTEDSLSVSAEHANAAISSEKNVLAIAPAVARLMRLSFDEEHRFAMCQLGALYTLARLIQADHEMHNGDIVTLDSDNITVRRYAGMALTNLTFGDCTNKALLCSLKSFMVALVAQLNSPNEDLCQVTASVLRNLSWRADTFIKQSLRDVDSVTMLMKTALRIEKEPTLKAVLSALWNLSAHSNTNKVDICNVDGAIEYLVKMLNYQAPSGTLVIVENVGGILRNISSLIAIRDDFRVIIREHNCLRILLHQLKSPSLTIVSNACGTLWNLTARCVEDQCTLWQLGAVPMLRSLIHSKHKMISVASTAALKNLLSARTEANIVDNNRVGTLAMRKQRALEQEIDARMLETSGVNKAVIMEQYEPLRNSPDLLEQNIEYTLKACSSAETAVTSTLSSCIRSPNTDSIGKKIMRKEDVIVKIPKCDADYGNIIVCNDSSELPISLIKKNGYVSNSCEEEEDTLSSKTTDGFRKVDEPYNVDDSFGDYAETDLDQPTNYSLRFTEQGSDIRRVGNDVEREDVCDGSANQTTPVSDKKEQQHTPIAATVAENSSFETPLMFSRSSSLGSVSSCNSEPVDDRSSVVSEFSRDVSGAISPSELPDSPAQTVPSSPRAIAGPKHTDGYHSIEPSLTSMTTPTTTVVDGKSQSKIPVRSSNRSVFEDTVTVFKNENTPVQFSVATSLSSLTFEDDDSVQHKVSTTEYVCMSPSSSVNHQQQSSEINDDETTKSTLENDDSLENNHSVNIEASPLNTSNSINSSTASDTLNTTVVQTTKIDPLEVELSMEEQLAMLKACIDSGKPSITTQKRNSCNDKDKYVSLQCEKKSSIERPAVIPGAEKNMVVTSSTASTATSMIATDSTINYCTEDTPISISHAASNSDLSLLCPSEDSFLENSMLSLSSCPDDQLDMELSTEEQENLLNYCIAKGLQSLSYNSFNSRDGKKSSRSSKLSKIAEDLSINRKKNENKCKLKNLGNV